MSDDTGPVTPNQVIQYVDYFDQFAGEIADLSTSISRVPAPATIVDRVTSAVAKLNSAERGFSSAAIGLRNGAGTQELLALTRAAGKDISDGLTALGLLGATACPDLY